MGEESDWVETGRTEEATFASLGKEGKIVAKGKEWKSKSGSWGNRFYWNLYYEGKKLQIISGFSGEKVGSIYMPEMLWQPDSEVSLKKLGGNRFELKETVDVSYDFHIDDDMDMPIEMLFDLKKMQVSVKTHQFFLTDDNLA